MLYDILHFKKIVMLCFDKKWVYCKPLLEYVGMMMRIPPIDEPLKCRIPGHYNNSIIVGIPINGFVNGVKEDT
jgi:hypothetical protein